MNLSKTRVVIVGAGQAGARAAEALRAAGHCGPITLIGEEPHLPHDLENPNFELKRSLAS